jgi:hypothetical protein
MASVGQLFACSLEVTWLILYQIGEATECLLGPLCHAFAFLEFMRRATFSSVCIVSLFLRGRLHRFGLSLAAGCIDRVFSASSIPRSLARSLPLPLSHSLSIKVFE